MDGLYGLLVIILLKVVPCLGEYCYDTTGKARGNQWCDHGCCETDFGTGHYYCCEFDGHWVLFIVGGLAVFGVACIVAFVCWYKQYTARRRMAQTTAVHQASVPDGYNSNQLPNNYGIQPSVPPPAYPGPGVPQNFNLASDTVYPPSAGLVYPPPPPQQSNFRRF